MWLSQTVELNDTPFLEGHSTETLDKIQSKRYNKNGNDKQNTNTLYHNKEYFMTHIEFVCAVE